MSKRFPKTCGRSAVDKLTERPEWSLFLAAVHLCASITGVLGRISGRLRWSIVIGLLALFAPTTAPAQVQTVPAPKVREYVTDQTGTLSPSDVSLLNEKLRTFDTQTSTQIVVVMLPTIGENILEEVSLKVAEANGIGRKAEDNGILLLIVKNDRLMRIEVGYGLEGALTDALSSQIIRKEITPRFREADFAGGINAGVDAIMAATRNEYKADPAGDPKKKTFGFPFILLIIIFAIIMLRRRRSGINRWGGGGFPPIGGGFGGGGSFGGGGGFSGGGGSFGGGGASGSW